MGNNKLNSELRKKIIDMAIAGNGGHIPSAFSILDIVVVLYQDFLKFDSKNPKWGQRDYFILSKGHGCLALYVVLHKHGFITEDDLALFCKPEGILGEHPDCTRVPSIEASTGSLGHGFPFAVGIALGLATRKMTNRIFVLVGDGECHEGTIWEAAHVANNLQLGNICVIVDWNGSAAQLMPRDDLPAKWKSFGWETTIIDGHSPTEIARAFSNVTFSLKGNPHAIIAKTVKGKGVEMMEGHGPWHHRIPNEADLKIIMDSLS